MAQTLAGKSAVITGGASGIGRAIAEIFVEHGARVAVLDRNREAAETVARELAERGTVLALSADVADSDSMNQAIDGAAEALGGLDIVVAAAGILDETPLLEMSVETFETTLNIDLKGVFLAARWSVPHLIERGGGRIINIASQLGIKGGVGLTHYVAAKAGVIGMTKALALELAEHQILVNTIAPGPIHTPLVDGLSEEWKQAKQAELPLGRFGRAEEVAPTALLLASSPGGDLYTGQTLGPNSGDVMP
ncbi:MAG: SDR family NAD(P)-dependent oxidoreductase [Micrococcaceae bacterium]